MTAEQKEIELLLFDRHACWEKLGRKIGERMFISKERRERELLMLSVEERYRLFLSRYKHLENRIPQYHIAAYFGITPVALKLRIGIATQFGLQNSIN